MKFILIGLAMVIGLLMISQIWAKKAVGNTETFPYTVVKKYDGFEIRKYESANFIYTTMNKDNYKESSGNGFRTLAGYIFGGNSENKEIAMTSPVEMEMDDTITMKFMIPSEYAMEDMPDPNDKNVKFVTEPERLVATITFGGWANDEKIASYTEQLKTLLKEAGIKHSNEFSFLGYNAPFELVNRKNEILVEVKTEN